MIMCLLCTNIVPGAGDAPVNNHTGVFYPGAYIPWKKIGNQEGSLTWGSGQDSGSKDSKLLKYYLSKTPSDGHPCKKQELREPYLKDVQMQIHTVGHQDQYRRHRILPGSVKKTMLWILCIYSTWLPPRILSTFEVSCGFTMLCLRCVRSCTKFQFYLYNSKINETQTLCLSHFVIFLWKILQESWDRIASILRLRWATKRGFRYPKYQASITTNWENIIWCFTLASILLKQYSLMVENVPSAMASLSKLRRCSCHEKIAWHHSQWSKVRDIG